MRNAVEEEPYDQDDGFSAASSGHDNFKVVVRIRPPLPRELRSSGLRPYQCTTHVESTCRNITLSENLTAVLQGLSAPAEAGSLYSTYRFTFDHVYDQHCSQEDIYSRSAQHVVLSILQGYNAAIIAYGQTGTGKTFTMEGELAGPHRGIIPRTVEDIFTYIVNDPEPTRWRLQCSAAAASSRDAGNTAVGSGAVELWTGRVPAWLSPACSACSKYLVRASYLQIYNEVISDLLKPERTNLAIREDRRRGVFVEGLSEWVVRSPAEVYQLMERGQALRTTGATKLNEVSSRSHAVCIVIVEKCTAGLEGGGAAGWPRAPAAGKDAGASHSIKVGKLNLVDLAGSERVHVTGAVGKRLEESKRINASLSALGNVISALTDRRGERAHIPYRDSKLTRILEDSLGGNCRTTMICTIAPSLEAYQESLSSLKFANRAKSIKNEAHVNEDVDQRTLLRKYERELRKLRAELQRRSKELVDKRALLEVEEQKRRAEADKLAALTALEKRSREFMQEKEEKRALEARISAMQARQEGRRSGHWPTQPVALMKLESQLLVGGVALGAGAASPGGGPGGLAGARLEDVPAFKQLLQKEHKRIRGEYESRLRELESERQLVQEDRQQVDRYKQLLLKQRDIMIALTARLNERDEQIMALQEELEAFDRYQRQLEDALDNKTAELFSLRKVWQGAKAGAEQGQGRVMAALEHASSSQGPAAGPGPPGRPGSGPGPTASSLAALLSSWGNGSGGPGAPLQLLPGTVSLSGESSCTGAQEVALRSSSDKHMQGNGSSSNSLVALGATEVERMASMTLSTTPSMPGSDEAAVGAAQQAAAQAAQMSRLASENTELQQQLEAALAAKAANGAQFLLLGEAQQRVEVLASACAAAQKERTALQQILDTKVKRMLSELAREVEQSPAQASSSMHEVSHLQPALLITRTLHQVLLSWAGQGHVGSGGCHSALAVVSGVQRLLSKLRTMESVLTKISDAVGAAPPILPPGMSNVFDK
ncbi:hypothetical protein QJQ45_016507 [Haematococcus lacustris]|nr:hypothetical protein QJQ45_016507 [Haematococcus lacustris]